MEPLKTYDYLVKARGRIFDWVRPLAPDDYTRQFAIGPGSIARTLTHIMISEWYYIKRMREEEVAPYTEWPIRDEEPPAFGVLEAEWAKQAAATRAAIGAVRDWTGTVEYQVTDDNGKRLHITATRGDIFTQLVLHEVHHRAQVMNMLRQVGMKMEDVDYNAMMYGRREV